MKNHNFVPAKGYVLFDVLLALFLFSLGFAALFGLTVGALYESGQASNLMEGANLAQSKMDRLAAHEWSDNFARRDCVPGGIVEGTDGRFHWLIRSEWHDSPELLEVGVEVHWMERGHPYQYKLESLYAVE
ncbi:MAG TPA: hypothetical protein DEF42_20880 [Desulfosporosinus sp.]|nr:hypothetical protein [Desulfosporosinus sp.]